MIFINKLANNIYNMFLGMNIDDKQGNMHRKFEKAQKVIQRKIEEQIRELEGSPER